MQLSHHGACGFRTGRLALLAGLAACPLFMLSAQDRPAMPLPAGSPFRIAVAQNVTPGCGTAVAPTVLQQNAEMRLRSVGLTVSDIHNAKLGIDVDCVPVTSAGGRNPGRSLAVHQCLGFSEVVSAAAGGGQPMLADTWRQCESYICESEKCQATVDAGLTGLVDTFLSVLAERSSEPPVRPLSSGGATGTATPYERVIFFGLYTITCLTMFLYWQIRKRALARVG
jgi:hypothetical protein